MEEAALPLTQPTVALAMARDLAAMLRDEPRVRRLWVWSEHGHIDPALDYVELWLHIDTDDEGTNYRVSRISASLPDQYPDVIITVYRLTPTALDGHAPEEAMRTEARSVPTGRASWTGRAATPAAIERP